MFSRSVANDSRILLEGNLSSPDCRAIFRPPRQVTAQQMARNDFMKRALAARSSRHPTPRQNMPKISQTWRPLTPRNSDAPLPFILNLRIATNKDPRRIAASRFTIAAVPRLISKLLSDCDAERFAWRSYP